MRGWLFSDRGSARAFGGLELHPPVERIAGIVPAGADDHFARALAGCDDPAAQGTILVLQTVLDVIGPQARQAIIDRRQSRRAGVADDLQTALARRSSLGDLLEPGVVGRADATVRIELGRAGLEQEFHRQLVALEPVIDDLAERIHRLPGAVKLEVGEIDAVQYAQLFAARRLQRALLDVERVTVA